MWSYEKRLQFPVNIKEPNAKIAQVIMSQYGGRRGAWGLHALSLTALFHALPGGSGDSYRYRCIGIGIARLRFK